MRTGEESIAQTCIVFVRTVTTRLLNAVQRASVGFFEVGPLYRGPYLNTCSGFTLRAPDTFGTLNTRSSATS